MLAAAIVLFGIAALGGVIMALRVIGGGFPPWALSLLHGLLGAAGLVSLALLVLSQGVAGPLAAALGLFLVAALGGFFLASFHLRQKPHPKLVVVLHGLLAVAGFVLLIGVAFGGF